MLNFIHLICHTDRALRTHLFEYRLQVSLGKEHLPCITTNLFVT